MATMSEREALAMWCQALPELESSAVDGGWQDTLYREAARVREGASAVDAFRVLGYDPNSGQLKSVIRPGELPDLPGLAAPVIPSGRYGCPQGRCSRLDGRDADGHVPVCRVHGRPLRLQG